jgi:hypothetical protein
MKHEKLPVQSLKSLIYACIVAVLLAVVILFVAVLPAEYGIDPTGLGRKIGLTAFSEMSRKTAKSQAQETLTQQPQAEEQGDSALNKPSADNRPLEIGENRQWKDDVKIFIPPKKGLEYKFSMQKGAELEYSWQTDGTSIYFDFHGEPKGARDGYFKSYVNIMDNSSKGVLTAPFEGIHGWYWENDTSQPVVIELHTNGTYQILGVMK